MKIMGLSIHDIDYLINKTTKINTPNPTEIKDGDLNEYIRNLLNEIKKNKNKREFKFGNKANDIKSSLDEIVKGNFEHSSEINAQRLLSIEQKTQLKMSHITDLQKGNLIQAYVEDNNQKKIILIKVDPNDFLELEVNIKRTGLPYKKKIFKSFTVEVMTDNKLGKVYVTDTNNPMAKYWWEEYLELFPKYDDEHNTTTSLRMLDIKIFNPIKKKHPADHTILRNSMIGYFRNNQEFNLESFIDKNFTSYTPVDHDLNIHEIIEEIRKLPEDKFDPIFNIRTDKISKRMVKQKITLNPSMDLVLNDHIENISDLVHAEQDNEGNKYIKIKTDDGYERFKK